MITRATFGLSDEQRDYLRREADRRGVSMASVLRDSIATDKYLREAVARGSRILVEENGTLSRLLIPS